MSNRAFTAASLARRLRVAQLAIFESVVEAGSIAAASRELAMTQPAVSKSIKELEHQLGDQLFVRSKGGVELTEFGQLFARHAQVMMSDLQGMSDELNAWHTGTTGQIAVGATATAAAALLPEAISRLRELAPDVVVTVHIDSNATLLSALMRGELDLIVGFLPVNSSTVLHSVDPTTRLLHTPLYSEGLSVVVGTSNPLAKRTQIHSSELRRLEWIVPTTDSAAYPAVREFFAREGLNMPRQLVRSRSLLTNVGLLARRPCLALIPHSVAVNLADSGLVSILPLPGLEPFSTVGYTRLAQRQPGNAAVKRFTDVLHALGEALQQGHSVEQPPTPA